MRSKLIVAYSAPQNVRSRVVDGMLVHRQNRLCLRRCSHLRMSLLHLESHLLLQPHDLESLEVCQVAPPVPDFSLLGPA